MSIYALFAATVLIWGSTWIAITFQLGVVPEAVSLVWRFLLASLCLFAYALLRRKPIVFPWREHPWLLLQGVGLFGINYLFMYLATSHVTSGLVAVVFSTIVFLNIINERIFFKTPIEARVIVAALLGLAGIGVVFWPEVARLSADSGSLRGLALALTGTLLASWGNMAAVRNIRRQLPLVRLNAWSMLYGAAGLALLAVLRGQPFLVEWETSYLVSLAYLALLGSVAAFACYLVLIHRIGSARAAYVAVLFPAVALVLSTVFEGYQWTPMAFAGLALVLVGNFLALTGKRVHPSFKEPGAA